ncbi:MAG TPA: carboxypeptidase regulatory-like domain-containing protein [Pyrinomonadaceae bacterium]|nr:carboxypeptidase regulatory-like domain-containing protein [Pyrinomonadaceae bacterium]
MSFSARYVPAFLFTILTLAVNVSAQTTTSQTTKAPRGSISGRVTIKDKGAAGVAIGLRKNSNDSFEQYSKVVTDHDGFYRIPNLRAGAYEVYASAPAFVVTDNNSQRSKVVIVNDDEEVDDINFSLVRGGVITGKVTDADGRPLIMQQVQLFPAEVPDPQQGRGPLRPVYLPNVVVTDDRGVYRMYGLVAGRYKVAAGKGDDANVGSFALTRTTYKQVFHPDVAEYPKAKVIEVSEGSETANVDIALGRAQTTFMASGRVIDSEKNVPVPNLRLGVQRVAAGQRVEMVPTLVTTNAQGDFILEGLIPGKYAVYVFQASSQNPVPDMRAEQSNFDVVDQDVSGIIVRLTKGASLSGVVVLESEDKTAWKKLQEMQLRAFVMSSGSGGFGQSSSSPIGPDGSFRLGGLASGTVNIFLTAAMGNPMATKGFMISRIERDGIAMQQRVEVKEGEQISGVRVVIAYGNSTLRGVVKIENGSLPPEGRISARLARPGESMGISMMPPPQVDARGHFILEGLPAGSYELIVSVNMGTPGQARTVKQTVTLLDGIINDVVVTIDMGATPK